MSSARLQAAYCLPDTLALEPAGTCTRVRGRALLVARAGWLAAVLSTVALFVAGLPFRQAELAATLDGLSPAQDLVLRELGVSAQQQARLVLLAESAVPALFLAIALLVFWRRSDDWVAIFVSAGLVTYIAWVSPTLTALASAEAVWRVPATFVQAAGMTFAVTFFLIFPDGRFIPRWTRAFLVLVVAWAVAWVLLPASPFDLSDVYRLPLPAFGVVMTCWAVGIGAQLYRFSHVSSQVQRQQTKWVMSATFVAIAVYLLFGFNRFIVPLVAGPLLPQVVYDLIGVPLFLVVLLVIPTAFAISILRYRLWDIDIIVNRVLVYGTLTAIVGGTFPTAIALSQRLFVALTGETSDAAIVLTVLVVGSIFTSVKGRLQALVDRHVKPAAGPRRGVTAFEEQVRSVIEVLDVEQLARRACEEAHRTFDAVGGAVYLLKEGRFELVHACGEWTQVEGMVAWLESEGHRYGWVALGPRRNGAAYQEEDQRQFSEMAALTARAMRLVGEFGADRAVLTTDGPRAVRSSGPPTSPGSPPRISIAPPPPPYRTHIESLPEKIWRATIASSDGKPPGGR
jgi:hypothetical protein